MAENLRSKPGKSRKASPKPSIIRVRKKVKATGVSVKDLVGTIHLTVDPVEFQRAIRNEWG